MDAQRIDEQKIVEKDGETATTSAVPWPIDAYGGVLLNHLEMLYQPGEREIAVDFCRLFGWEVVDTGAPSESGSTYLFVHLEPSDRDRLNNTFYLSEVRPEQAALESALRQESGSSSTLADAFAAYRRKARTRPHGIPHCGIRYRSFEDVEQVVERLQGAAASPASPLLGRISVDAVRPGDARSMTDELVQAFVYTDVMCSGLFVLGQLFELQGQRRPAPDQRRGRPPTT